MCSRPAGRKTPLNSIVIVVLRVCYLNDKKVQGGGVLSTVMSIHINKVRCCNLTPVEDLLSLLLS